MISAVPVATAGLGIGAATPGAMEAATVDNKVAAAQQAETNFFIGFLISVDTPRTRASIPADR